MSAADDATARDDPGGIEAPEDVVRRILSAVVTAIFTLSLSAAAVGAGGPPALAFYVDGERYRTVGTPTDFSNTGAPLHSFDAIYALGGDLINVAEAAPGQPGFNGGRWRVLPVTWNVAPVQLTSDEQVLAYAAAGWIEIASTPARMFECPVIPVGGRR